MSDSEINNIPKHWQVKKLGEVCQKISLNGIKIKQKEIEDKFMKKGQVLTTEDLLMFQTKK